MRPVVIGQEYWHMCRMHGVFFAKCLSLKTEHGLSLLPQVERTHSAPGCGVLPGFFPTAVGHLGLSCDDVVDEVGSCEDGQLDDINRSLDLLAKKVTEAAIGGEFEWIACRVP